jgi:hypothetical protein
MKKFGQLPIFPYGVHSKEEMKEFAKKDNDLSRSWVGLLIPYLQSKLDSAGIKTTLTKKHTDWILNNTDIVERRIKKFKNSSRYGNEVHFDKLYDYNFEGMVGVFHYDGLQVIIFKANCLNLLKVDGEVIQVAPVIAPPPLPAKKDTVYLPAPKKEELPPMAYEQPKKPDTIIVEKYYYVNNTQTVLRECGRPIQMIQPTSGWYGYNYDQYQVQPRINIGGNISVFFQGKQRAPQIIPQGRPVDAQPLPPLPGGPVDTQPLPGGPRDAGGHQRAPNGNWTTQRAF